MKHTKKKKAVFAMMRIPDFIGRKFTTQDESFRLEESKISTQEIDVVKEELNLIAHLKQQNALIETLQDIRDVEEMRRCTNALAETHNINRHQDVFILYQQLRSKIYKRTNTLQREEITRYNKALDHALAVFPSDFLNKRLRTTLNALLIKLNSKASLNSLIEANSLLFYKSYCSKKFEKAYYNYPKRQELEDDIKDYLKAVQSKVDMLNEIAERFYDNTYMQTDNDHANKRIKAITAILLRQIPNWQAFLTAVRNPNINRHAVENLTDLLPKVTEDPSMTVPIFQEEQLSPHQLHGRPLYH